MNYINWSVIITETDFQELFRLYWDAGDNRKLKTEIINELSKYTYHYLIRRFPQDFDMASEFFLECLDMIEDIIVEYEPSYHIPFLAFYTAKIKRRFFNYNNKYTKRKNLENINDFVEITPDLNAHSVFDHPSRYDNSDLQVKSIIQDSMISLSIDEEICLRLYYGFTLKYGQLKYLVKQVGAAYLRKQFNVYHNQASEKRKTEKEKREYALSKLYEQSIRIRLKDEDINPERYQRLQENFFKIARLVPMRIISDIFRKNITFVARRLKSAEKKIFHELIQKNYLATDKGSQSEAA